MGLALRLSRIDHEGSRAAWSYSGFHAFRMRLAAAVGIELDEMCGFGGAQRPWPTASEEALVPLLNHSDCDGQLDYTDCLTVAPRLRKVIAGWDADDYDRRQAEALLAMMDAVVGEDDDAFAIEFM